MAYVPLRKKKVLRVIHYDERNNRTLKENNFEIPYEADLEQAQKLFFMRTLTMKKLGKLRFDVITYDLDIMKEEDIPVINARNYKDIELENKK